MIEGAIKPLIRKGSRIGKLQLYVNDNSSIAQHVSVRTIFGELRIHPSAFVTQGVAFVREDFGRGKIGFAWITKGQAKEREAK